jgi:deoxyribose-phosphate aldolase
MRKYSAPGVKVKAAGGVRTLTDLLKFKELGINRCGATATVTMLEEARTLSVNNRKTGLPEIPFKYS